MSGYGGVRRGCWGDPGGDPQGLQCGRGFRSLGTAAEEGRTRQPRTAARQPAERSAGPAPPRTPRARRGARPRPPGGALRPRCAPGRAGRGGGRSAGKGGRRPAAAGTGRREPRSPFPARCGDGEAAGRAGGGPGGQPGRASGSAEPGGGGSCPAQGWGLAASLNGGRAAERARTAPMRRAAPTLPGCGRNTWSKLSRDVCLCLPPDRNSAAPGLRRSVARSSSPLPGLMVFGCWFLAFFVIAAFGCFGFGFFPLSPTFLLLLVRSGLFKLAGANAAFEKPRQMLQCLLWQ